MGKKKKNISLPQLPAGTSVIDTHCHLDMMGSGDDVSTIVSRAAACGVAPLITVGIDLDSSRKAIDFASRFNSVYATVGIHPHNVHDLDDTSYAELERLCRASKVVAFGEIGLDYVKQYAPKDIQLEHYARQVDLAKKMSLPIVIHDREAHADIMHILQRKSPFAAGGVMHCFSGDWDLARKVLDLGFVISIPGVVTFAKAASMQEVTRKIPLDKLILETDAPFLAPEPLRGKKNIPENVLYTARKIAELRDLSFEELARATTENARNLFRLPDIDRP
jgi:TatD DNase family protein